MALLKQTSMYEHLSFFKRWTFSKGSCKELNSCFIFVKGHLKGRSSKLKELLSSFDSGKIEHLGLRDGIFRISGVTAIGQIPLGLRCFPGSCFEKLIGFLQELDQAHSYFQVFVRVSWWPFRLMKPTFNGTPVPTAFISNDYENLASQNDTRDAEATRLEASMSSIIALIVLVTIIFTLVVTSLVTYCFHKWKLRGKKLMRAQEEYQKDQEKNILQGNSWLANLYTNSGVDSPMIVKRQT